MVLKKTSNGPEEAEMECRSFGQSKAKDAGASERNRSLEKRDGQHLVPADISIPDERTSTKIGTNKKIVKQGIKLATPISNAHQTSPLLPPVLPHLHHRHLSYWY
jgi:hypothetical protein